MQTPDITKAQIIAIVQAIIAVAAAFGLSMSAEQQTAIIGLAGALAVVLPIADAIIRNGRAKVYAAHVASRPDEQ